ncbi:hypothetical protein [Acidicapsa ligni]|uniref:hypothetical protein n=1 Tax=Acidicapsa ligni TaxID=542300 RepID=UPI0021DFAA1A|nr:hypothetical protein [Acidicapsa ligni]
MIALWNEEKPRQGKNGERWNFTYWYLVCTSDRTKDAQRLFFWNEKKSECGVVILTPDKTVRYSRIRSLIEKLVADHELRRKYQRDIEFPLERHYPEYGAFPEEHPA